MLFKKIFFTEQISRRMTNYIMKNAKNIKRVYFTLIKRINKVKAIIEKLPLNYVCVLYYRFIFKLKYLIFC